MWSLKIDTINGMSSMEVPICHFSVCSLSFFFAIRDPSYLFAETVVFSPCHYFSFRKGSIPKPNLEKTVLSTPVSVHGRKQCLDSLTASCAITGWFGAFLFFRVWLNLLILVITGHTKIIYIASCSFSLWFFSASITHCMPMLPFQGWRQWLRKSMADFSLPWSTFCGRYLCLGKRSKLSCSLVSLDGHWQQVIHLQGLDPRNHWCAFHLLLSPVLCSPIVAITREDNLHCLHVRLPWRIWFKVAIKINDEYRLRLRSGCSSIIDDICVRRRRSAMSI